MKYKAIILCANQSVNNPISLMSINGKEHFRYIIEALERFNIKDITVVCDFYNEDKFQTEEISYSVQCITDDKQSSLHSLCSNTIKGEFDSLIIIDGNIIFDERGIESLLNNNDDNAVIISNSREYDISTKVNLENNYINNIYINKCFDINKEMIGLTKISNESYFKLRTSYLSGINDKYENVLIDNLIDIHAIYIDDFYWFEILNNSDIDKIENEVLPRISRIFNSRNFIETVKKIFIAKVGDGIISIEPLGGMTNNNFLVKTIESYYVARIPGAGTNGLIDRKSESYNNHIASKIGIDLEPNYFSDVSGIKIVPYIDNAETLNPDTIKENKNRCMSVIKKLHNSDFLFKNKFDISNEIDGYYNNIINKCFFQETNLVEIKKQIDLVIGNYKKLKVNYVSCHNDLVAENFILSNDNTYIIDWEYSALNDPFWDLASFFIENNFNDKLELLNVYLGRNAKDCEILRLNSCIIFQDFLWSLWSIVKCEAGIDYYHYGLERFNRLKRNLDNYVF